jgi:dihydroorotate dehydrogenase
MYKALRQLLFSLDAEAVHHLSMRWLRSFGRSIFFSNLIKARYKAQDDPIEFAGLIFKNRVGLAAGFDKNAKYLHELDLLGFGHVEIGTVTPQPQPGNDRPRLFRLPKDKALINRMGFNNAGVHAAAGGLRHYRKYGKRQMIIGGNIGKNKTTPNEDAWRDYQACFKELHDLVDYFVVNVSSPNTPGLRELQDKDALKKILTTLQELNAGYQKKRPIFLKIAPDLTTAQLNDIVDLVLEIALDGMVVSNTTVSREGLKTEAGIVEKIGQGGLSGKPLMKQSTEVVEYINKQSNGKIPMIASGGIFTGKDAQEKLAVGASLVQVWTGFVYEGPGIAKRITKHLKKL